MKITFEQYYQSVSEEIWQKASQIKLLICDVDGVFSDGSIYLGNAGEELKAFHTQDGFGMKALVNAGIITAIITGRESHIVQTRMQSLKVAHIFQGYEDKTQAYEKIKKQLNLIDKNIAYIGDDIPDWSVQQQVGLSVAVCNAHPFILQSCDYTTQKIGGQGAVRETCDLLLLSQGYSLMYAGTSA